MCVTCISLQHSQLQYRHWKLFLSKREPTVMSSFKSCTSCPPEVSGSSYVARVLESVYQHCDCFPMTSPHLLCNSNTALSLTVNTSFKDHTSSLLMMFQHFLSFFFLNFYVYFTISSLTVLFSVWITDKSFTTLFSSFPVLKHLLTILDMTVNMSDPYSNDVFQ